MLADMNIISPLREASSSSGAQRRREDKLRAQKVLPRQQNDSPLNKERDEQDRGRGLNAYA